MIPLNSPELSRISKFLGKYEFRSTVSQLAALLTLPSLQANTVRIECLVHLAVASCQGKRKPALAQIDHWINRYLGGTNTAMQEDPVEDVFLTNIQTPKGDFRVFEGIWEANDYYLQVVVDSLLHTKLRNESESLLESIYALLTLSEAIASKMGLGRWTLVDSAPQGRVRLAPVMDIPLKAKQLIFSKKELNRLGIKRDALKPFILAQENYVKLKNESAGNSSLDRRPLIEIDEDIVVSLPPAISPAIRLFILEEFSASSFLDQFAEVLSTIQVEQLEKEGLFELRKDVQSVAPPKPSTRTPSLHSMLLKYDIDKYIHVILIHDDLGELLKEGLASFKQFNQKLKDGLGKYISDVAAYCKRQSDFEEGLTFVVMGGLGRGYMLPFKDWPEDWQLAVITLPNLLLLSSEAELPITRFLKSVKQKEYIEKMGVHIQNINGSYNFYSYWKSTNFQLTPRDFPIQSNSYLSLPLDSQTQVKKDTRELADLHSVKTVGGDWVRVKRYGFDSFFQSLLKKPIYVSMTHLNEGELRGVVQTSSADYWLRATYSNVDKRAAEVSYELWSSFLKLFEHLIREIEKNSVSEIFCVIEICLAFDSLVVSDDPDYYDKRTVESKATIDVQIESNSAIINFPEDFLKHFRCEDNAGEKKILSLIAKALFILLEGKGDFNKIRLDESVGKVVGDSAIRVLHLFKSFDSVELLQVKQLGNPRFLRMEDFVFAKLCLSEGCLKNEGSQTIRDKDACNEYLNRVVEKVWLRIRSRLRLLDRMTLVNQLLFISEASIYDRNSWNRTAKAIIALHHSDDDVFSISEERELKRVTTEISTRALLEMGICECPMTGGKSPSQWDVDELVALSMLLIEVAADSDAIRNDLVSPLVKIFENGEYEVSRKFQKEVISPFLSGQFQENFQLAADSYGDLYKAEGLGATPSIEESQSSDFLDAFAEEYGLSVEEAVEGLARLVQLATEVENVIVSIPLEVFRARLSENDGLSDRAVDAFIQTYCLEHRPNWDAIPSGFRMEDIYPWRYSRKLSLVSRPILASGNNKRDEITFGIGLLKQGFTTTFERCESGNLPQEFFISEKMRRYVGSINHKRGHEFEELVEARMKELGWCARREVALTELGGNAELGDVDVLAWKETGEVMIIECKRLQFARTVVEIAEICKKFKGESKDLLDKHIRRTAWLVSNPQGLLPVVGLDIDTIQLDHRLITNTRVPMMYIEGLPVDTKKIVPYSLISESV
jgi:hypothetical protein